MSESSSPERRKLGSIVVKRMPAGHVYMKYDDCTHAIPMEDLARALWAAAEQFEALQALARAFDYVPLSPRDFEQAIAVANAALDRVRTLGAIGKEDGDASS